MSRWPAFDHTIQAMAGMMWTGRDDDVPSQGRGFSVDCFTGYVAYASILSGLFRRERTGQGQYLDVAMLDASMVLLAVGSVRQMMTGDAISAVQPIVHDRPTVAPYRTTDGWIWLERQLPEPVRGALPGDRRARAGERPSLQGRTLAERPLRRAEGRACDAAGRPLGGRAGAAVDGGRLSGLDGPDDARRPPAPAPARARRAGRGADAGPRRAGEADQRRLHGQRRQPRRARPGAGARASTPTRCCASLGTTTPRSRRCGRTARSDTDPAERQATSKNWSLTPGTPSVRRSSVPTKTDRSSHRYRSSPTSKVGMVRA